MPLTVHLEQRNYALVFLGKLLPSPSLSDLCLKVYFSQDYSDAEFIIINIALYCPYIHPPLVCRHQTYGDRSL